MSKPVPLRRGDRVEWHEIVPRSGVVRFTGTIVRAYCDVAVDGEAGGVARRADIDVEQLEHLGVLDALADVLDE